MKANKVSLPRSQRQVEAAVILVVGTILLAFKFAYHHRSPRLEEGHLKHRWDRSDTDNRIHLSRRLLVHFPIVNETKLEAPKLSPWQPNYLRANLKMHFPIVNESRLVTPELNPWQPNYIRANLKTAHFANFNYQGIEKSQFPEFSRHKLPHHLSFRPHLAAINYYAGSSGVQQTPYTMHYQQLTPTKQFWRRKRVICAYDPEDEKVMEQGHANQSATPFIVINEARSGSSWLQEISQMNPGIKVQFELDLEYGPSALQCKQCHRPGNPDTKHPERIPPKRHPPDACGFTIFGSSNNVQKVREVAEYASGKVVILLRRNHVAHAISGYRHFQKIPRGFSRKDLTVPWSWFMLDKYAREKKSAYDKLVSYIGAGRPTHIIFYEDMKARVEDVWKELQAFLEVPPVTIPQIREAEAKSSSKPSVEYLDRLKDIRAAAAGSEWEAMLNDPQYDEKLDFGAEFDKLCRTYGPSSPKANNQLSWRGGKCTS